MNEDFTYIAETLMGDAPRQSTACDNNSILSADSSFMASPLSGSPERQYADPPRVNNSELLDAFFSTTRSQESTRETFKPLSTQIKSRLQPIITFKSSMIKEMDQTSTPEEPLPSEIPSETCMPMYMRCEFCQKFDSVCSSCHFKYLKIMESRGAELTRAFNSMPKERRMALYFRTILNGTLPFLRLILSSDPNKCSDWCGNLKLVPKEEPARSLFSSQKAVFGLHFAFAFGRLEAARLLLGHGDHPYRRCADDLYPHDFLPNPLPDEWDEMLQDERRYQEYQLSERAKALRGEGDFVSASLEYAELLRLNPKNENAILGGAKMLYEQGKLVECMERCKDILKDPSQIEWVEFSTSSAEDLRKAAKRELHKKYHSIPGSALKPCGCVIIDNIKVPIRGLSFSLVEYILGFCECPTLWAICRSTQVPLLRRACESRASQLCTSLNSSIESMLSREPGYSEMYYQIRANQPETNNKGALVTSPLLFMGLRIVAMADFNTFLLRSSVVGNNPKYREGSLSTFFKNRTPIEKLQQLVLVKEFRINRASPGARWSVVEAGEWEVDEATSQHWEEKVKQNINKK